MHMTQIFTDGVMLTLAALTLLFMASVTVWLIHWRDYEFVWSLAYCLIQFWIVSYFWIIWQSDKSPLDTFSVVGQIGRPATAGLWLLTVFYAIYRLRVKREFRE